MAVCRINNDYFLDQKPAKDNWNTYFIFQFEFIHSSNWKFALILWWINCTHLMLMIYTSENTKVWNWSVNWLPTIEIFLCWGWCVLLNKWFLFHSSINRKAEVEWYLWNALLKPSTAFTISIAVIKRMKTHSE